MDYDNIEPLVDAKQIFDLTDKVGLITGGTGKLGLEFARVLAKAGARIVISDVSQCRCDEAAAEIDGSVGIACDVSNGEQVSGLFSRVGSELGRLDFLICNVMAKPDGYYRQFSDYSEETWDAVSNANLKGTFLCSRAAASLMKKSGGGAMVFLASIYGLVAPDQRIYEGCKPAENPYGADEPLNLPGSYVATKGGIIAYSRYLATQLASDGIRANVLSPGGVYDGQERAFHEAYTGRTPMGRMATYSDFNGAILFLVSDASRYMTGSNLVVDGGWTAW